MVAGEETGAGGGMGIGKQAPRPTLARALGPHASRLRIYRWDVWVPPLVPSKIASAVALIEHGADRRGMAAIGAARAGRLQTSLDLAVFLGMPLQLGIAGSDLVLLSLTFLIGSITFVSGRTNMMQGAVHLVVFAAFLFLALVP
jgi:hypothetical protein